ncbi:hypothetical protein APHWI1_1248 [Anaplasma phagocytophilum str. ApWI1]|uniref:Uncharacterized protein n=2 Tax=Anaplasma phagocytophilum TaxID=948 RepID=A0A0F3NK89_ANAPH|nr:hypothetical protein EPHNCH_0462 [Anaplasma phagocytophilum str. NCH-1]KJV84400.1 hypothetical protein APHWI1_1248 [Anaplasma phagocytophilum str. ApWI1]KJZ98325.1 hypothetical protein APHCR_1202 [Anaplasma phagocytophilum str. CR1007]
MFLVLSSAQKRLISKQGIYGFHAGLEAIVGYKVRRHKWT